MKKPARDPGRGQLHRRSARAWRDEQNPTGPGVNEEPESEAEQTSGEATVGRDQALAPEEPSVESVNAGPGGGGATESAGRAKHQEGLHGGPSRKP
jgi:hypothetical protein